MNLFFTLYGIPSHVLNNDNSRLFEMIQIPCYFSENALITIGPKWFRPSPGWKFFE